MGARIIIYIMIDMEMDRVIPSFPQVNTWLYTETRMISGFRLQMEQGNKQKLK